MGKNNRIIYLLIAVLSISSCTGHRIDRYIERQIKEDNVDFSLDIEKVIRHPVDSFFLVGGFADVEKITHVKHHGANPYDSEYYLFVMCSGGKEIYTERMYNLVRSRDKYWYEFRDWDWNYEWNPSLAKYSPIIHVSIDKKLKLIIIRP